MTDIRIVNITDLSGVWTDWLFKSSGLLDETEELANLIKVALLTDALASEDDVLPNPDDSNRRGWWGNYEAETVWDGWPIGCKCWLLSRAKITGTGAREGSTLVRAEQYVRSALRPLIDKRICSRISVKAERAEQQRINVLVTIYRGPRDEIELRFQGLWTE